MKLKFKDLKKAIATVGVTKEDITIMAEEKTMVVSSNDVNGGIQVQAKVDLSGEVKQQTFSVSKDIKSGVDTLSEMGEEGQLLVEGSQVKLKVGEAKIKYGLLSETPPTIKVNESKVMLGLGGEEFLYAMNIAADTSEWITMFVKDKKFTIYSIASTKLFQTEFEMFATKGGENGVDVNSVYPVDDNGYSFTIQSDIWKKVSGVVSAEPLAIHLCDGQIKIACENVIVVIPLVEKDHSNFLKVYATLHEGLGNNTICPASSKELFKALNVALVAEKEPKVTVAITEGEKECCLSSDSGKAMVKLKEEVADDFKGSYNGSHLKLFFNAIKGYDGLSLTLCMDKFMFTNIELSFVYSIGGNEKKNIVRSEAIFTPVVGDEKKEDE